MTDLQVIYACLTAVFGVLGLLGIKGAPIAASITLTIQLAGLGYALATTAFIAATLIVIGSIIYGLGFCVAQIIHWSDV